MNAYRKKPVVVQAVQFTEALRDAALFDGQPLPDGVCCGATTLHPPTRKVWSATFYIETLEGRMTVEVGDWIITGVKGERYPCKPDIFAATYEPALDEARAALAEPVADEPPYGWHKPCEAPLWHSPVFIVGHEPPSPFTRERAVALGWIPVYTRPAAQEPVADESVARAVAAETERCAREAEHWQDISKPGHRCGTYIAAAIRATAAPVMLNGLTEAETMATASVAGLSDTRPAAAPSERGEYPPLPEPVAVARAFHEAYERLAPQFGYSTRQETRQFDPESPNGKLMQAVCHEVLRAYVDADRAQRVPSVSDEMVSRFLAWPLPKDFYPDCGISFDGRKDDEWNKNKTWPTGTNLLTAEQARAMLRHVLCIGQSEGGTP